MEGLGILLFIILALVQLAQKLAEKGAAGQPRDKKKPWKGAGLPWPDPDKSWQWEEEEEDWPEPDPVKEVRKLPVEGREERLLDENNPTVFKGKHSPLEDGKAALIKEDIAVNKRETETPAVLDHALAEPITAEQAAQGVIFAEIIGPPRARRPFYRARF